MDEERIKPNSNEKALSEANQCIALGVGVGGLGAAAALTLGATCPLCFVVAPALVGIGLVKRISQKRKLSKKAALLSDGRCPKF